MHCQGDGLAPGATSKAPWRFNFPTMSRNGIFTATDGPLEGFEVDLADPKLFCK
jgi:hypothetical protein